MTRVDQAVKEIKEMILNHQYDEAGYLLSEGELSEKLEVSRATIREAIRTLEVRGFVKRMHGKGIKVSDNGVHVMTRSMRDMFDRTELSLDEVLEVRWIIETKAAEMAAIHIEDDELAELEELVIRMEDATELNEEYLKCDSTFHKKLAECSRNKMLSAIVNAYSAMLDDLIKASSNTKVNLENVYHYHRNIYEAVKAHDVEVARKTISEHLIAGNENKKIK